MTRARGTERSIIAVVVAALAVTGFVGVPGSTWATATTDARNETIATGDTLIPNYSFEDDRQGWAVHDAETWAATPACSAAASVGSDWAVTGAKSAHLTASDECEHPALESTAVPVTPGTTYTAFTSIRTLRGPGQVALRFRDAAGTVVSTTMSTPEYQRDGVAALRASAAAPGGAATATVGVTTVGVADVDDVLISARFTDLGPQITVNAVANGTAYSVDPNGRDVAYTVVTGAHGVDARLVGIDVITAEVTLDLPVPRAMGAWNATSTPDGTIYITAYNYADAGMGGRLYSYRPGDTAVTDLGAPVPGDTFTYGAVGAPDGTVYGGTYPSGALWRYTPGSGFSAIGPRPILPGVQYVRSVGYDASTGLVFAGTGATAHVVACSGDGTGDCVDILPSTYSQYPWTYNLSADGGHVFARVTDDHGDDHLVVLEASKAPDGSIQSSVVNDIPGLSFPGVSNAADGKVYYAKAGRLFSYDTATESETDLGVNTGIFARQWRVLHLADQTNYPGYTVVGTNSGGIVARYNIQTRKFERNQVAALPKAVADIETIVGGPDGKVYSSGYLVGGLGIHSPMRSDRLIQHAGNRGYGQAEGMTVLGDRIFQGVYPGAHVRSFDVATAASGGQPRADCDIANDQDRPYAMLAANGRIYAGTMAIYGQTSGALTVYDPATGRCDVYRDVVHNQSVVALTYAAGKVFGGSLIWGGLGAEPTEPEAKLLVFDPATGTSTTVDLPVRGLRAITAMVTAPDGKVWMLAQNYLLAYDPASGSWVHSANAFPDLQYGDDRISAYDSKMVVTQDGRVYGVIRQRHFFSLDTSTASVSNILDDSVQNIAVDGYGNVYVVYHASHLLRYVPEPPTR